MTLRDYFAAKAMQGMCGAAAWPEERDHPGLVLLAYQIADAMLKERMK